MNCRIVYFLVFTKFQHTTMHGMKNKTSQSISKRFEDVGLPNACAVLCGR